MNLYISKGCFKPQYRYAQYYTGMEITKFRELNNEKLPFWYHGYLHVALNGIILSLLLCLSFQRLPTINLRTLGKVLLFLFAWSIIEYLIHRFILHGKLFSRQHFQQQHSVFHHGYFTVKNMNWKALIDINRVLLMPIDIVSVLLLNLAAAYVVSFVAGEENGTYFFFTGIMYLIIYEVLHGLCHTESADSMPVIRHLVRHHQIHHTTVHMETRNFSVTSPWIDSLFRSKLDV